jgi:hypothetical protein
MVKPKEQLGTLDQVVGACRSPVFGFSITFFCKLSVIIHANFDICHQETAAEMKNGEAKHAMVMMTTLPVDMFKQRGLRGVPCCKSMATQCL